jgi:hypothetical protein
MLRMGLEVSQVEQRLVADGLSPEAATAIVAQVLGEGFRQRVAALARAERRDRLHQMLSGVVGCACLGFAYWRFGPESAGRTLLVILLPLASIWFPDGIAAYIGGSFPLGTWRGVFIRWCAWLVLIVVSGRLLWFGLILTS